MFPFTVRTSMRSPDGRRTVASTFPLTRSTETGPAMPLSVTSPLTLSTSTGASTVLTVITPLTFAITTSRSSGTVIS